MDTVQDFEDMLRALEKYHVRYLIIGGLAGDVSFQALVQDEEESKASGRLRTETI